MAKFGALPNICCLLWDRINPYKTMPSGVHKKHLLLGLYFLRVYDIEENCAQNVRDVEEKLSVNGHSVLWMQFSNLRVAW